jgi:hypothetical protein
MEWSEGSKAYSGTLQIRLRFHYKNILGPFRITANGQTHNYRFYGRMKSKTTEEALIVFLIYNTNGGYADDGTITAWALRYQAQKLRKHVVKTSQGGVQGRRSAPMTLWGPRTE